MKNKVHGFCVNSQAQNYTDSAVFKNTQILDNARMGNRVSELRDERGWTQEQLADKVNETLEANPELKKITKKNPAGLVVQQDIQRREKGTVALDERWMNIFSIVFGVSHNEITGNNSESPLFKKLRQLNEQQQSAFEAMIDAMIKDEK